MARFDVAILDDEQFSHYEDLLQTLRLSFIGDSWGTCMSWMFAVADYQVENGFDVDPAWQFRQALSGPNCEAPEYEELCFLGPDGETLDAFGSLLFRWRNKLEAAGRSY